MSSSSVTVPLTWAIGVIVILGIAFAGYFATTMTQQMTNTSSALVDIRNNFRTQNEITSKFNARLERIEQTLEITADDRWRFSNQQVYHRELWAQIIKMNDASANPVELVSPKPATIRSEGRLY